MNEQRRLLPGLLALVVLAGCSGAVTSPRPASPTPPAPAASPSPSSTPAGALEQFVADLGAAHPDVRLGAPSAAGAFPVPGVVVCVATNPVIVYTFGSEPEAVAAAAKIDRTNPSNMGTTMVEWNGRPRLWQRERLIVVYLGEDAATDAALRKVLGEPFASGPGHFPLPDPSCG
ncbi:MAG: hypothetical protein ABIV26_04990 [Candidatus Limnocylindrales bacterium]